MSVRIKDYPGREVAIEELKERYVAKEYKAVLRYAWSSGVAIGSFLDGLKRGIILGRRCNKCRRILVPPRMYCEQCFRKTDSWVRVKDTGEVKTFSISYVNVDASRRREPIIVAVVKLDGASKDVGILHILGEVKPEKVRIGMHVKAVWKKEEERKGAITDILYFKPR